MPGIVASGKLFFEKNAGPEKRPRPPTSGRRLCPSLASRRGNNPAQIEVAEQMSLDRAQ